jgi:hypothetical protein
VSGIDEQVADGRYVLDVIVTAGTAAAAQELAPALAKPLDARLRLALRGRLHAAPVKVPKLKAGPPADWPDLSVLALRKTDLGGKVSVSKSYVVDPTAISDYSVLMFPAGPFDLLEQEIEWYPVANEASFFVDFENAVALSQHGTTALDLRTIGDGAGKRHGRLAVQRGPGLPLQRPARRIHLHREEWLDQRRRRDGRGSGSGEQDRRSRARELAGPRQMPREVHYFVV